ncbi:MAG TPA: hypothetical protein VK177_08785 [Flavobacteriales bacterium]|nr:hypothetical protein [Flavobacteriales bacterium]
MSTVSLTCIECGTQFKGRSDKKFCTDQCRSSYNNKQNSDANSIMKNINHSLRKNRRILSSLLDDGKDKIGKDKLVQKGFNFSYFTHSFTSKSGKQYQFWYDHGLMQMDNGGYFIVRDRKEETK